MDKPQPAYRGDEPYVFVCYAHADKNVVYPEILWLQEHGIRIWYDEGISAGKVWRLEIGEAIQGADKFLFYISSRSLKSDHCNREVSVALDDRKAILPIYLEDTALTPDLKVGLARLQAIHRTNDDDYQRHLVEALGQTTRGTGPSSSIALQKYAAQRQKPMLAVLPFENLSGDIQQEFFSDGIAEDVLNGLGHSPDVVVRARHSSFSFRKQQLDTKTIAERLNVTHIVSGSVRTSGNRVRVNARLTSVAHDIEVWSDRYDRELADVFAVQDEITESILRSLDLHFSHSGRRRVSLDAYNAYLLGRYHNARFDFGNSIAALECAIEIEPKYVEALSSLAQMHSALEWLGAYGRDDLRETHRSNQRAYLQRALTIDPDEPIARGLQAMWLQPQDAINELNRLIRRYPNNPELLFFYSGTLRIIGRSDLVLAVFDQLVALDPLSPSTLVNRAGAKLSAGRFEDAMNDIRAAERLGVPAPETLALYALHRRDSEALESQVERDPATWSQMPQLQTIMKASVSYLRGDRFAVQQALSSLGSDGVYVSNLVRFRMALLKHQNTLALEHFRSALHEREPLALLEIQGSQVLRSLFPEYFAQPGYEVMLRDFCLDPESVAKLVIPELPF